MARFSRDAIDTFMSITGAPETVALQKLEVRSPVAQRRVDQYGYLDHITFSHFLLKYDTIDNGPLRPSFPLFSATRDVNPFSLLDSKFGLFSSLFDSGGASSFPRLGPRVSHPREVKEIPIDFKDNNRGCGPSGVGPRIEEVTGNETAHGHEIHGTVIIDDEDDDGIQPTHGGHGAKSSADTSLGQCAGPSVSPLADMTDYSNEIEEEMIKAAIEASKREAQQHVIKQFDDRINL
ncbi:hypothetical protein B296_00025197 [Ensete ventricosum]|uniref:Uncharacterized protein n=1 Tax=Ensete ventricosum TaxID=4639 RepID=A0A426YD59_ENSVE|nr:hypothetical protein B296_00025197 [Ensete ventricosum]